MALVDVEDRSEEMRYTKKQVELLKIGAPMMTWGIMLENYISALDEIERLQSENEWLPMDSAPKDGTFVLLLQDKEVYKAAWLQNYGVVCRRSDPFEWCIDSSYQDEQGYYSTVNPEKWRPLPQPPEETKRRMEGRRVRSEKDNE